MSRSNPTATNPATRFFQWRGGAEKIVEEKGGKKTSKYEGGRVTWYDKTAEEEVEVKLPFSFLVLDELHTITGFSESDHSGFWSNEVRDLKNEPFTVKTKSGTKARGTYEQIKDSIKAQGARYCKSVYIAFKDDAGELAIGNIKIAGAALTSWIEFQKKFNVMECAVYIDEKPKLDKKGTNYYFTPVFGGQEITEESNKEAVALDEELQAYLDTYLVRRENETEDEVEEEVEEEVVEEVEEEVVETTAVPANGGDDKIDLKDVPF